MSDNARSRTARWRRTSTRLFLLAVGVGLALLWFARPAATPPLGSGMLMQAIVYREYGSPDVLRLERVEKLLPGDHQVLIRVRAASANPLDYHYMRGTPYVVRVMSGGLTAPGNPRLGADVAGVVEAVGAQVTQFKPGDEVFGTGRGAFADYVLASDTKIVPKPGNIGFDQAAAVPVAALTALQSLRDKARVRAGQKVLVNGASGGVGTFAVQIAKSMGAEVTAVCSTRNVALVRSIGADHVIDYTKDDFTQGTERYDVIIDTVGNHGLLDLRRAMAPDGVAVLVGGRSDMNPWIGPFVGLGKVLLLSPFVSQRFESILAEIRQDDLRVMSDLMVSGKVRPVIDRTYALAEAPEAIRYLEKGRARGKVIIAVSR